MLTLFIAMCRTSEMHIRNIIVRRYEFDLNTFRVIQSLYAVIYIPGAIIGTIIFNKYSLRTGVLVGSVLTVLGSGLKILISQNWVFMPIGHCINAFAFPIIAITPARFAVVWFEDSKRVIAISALLSSAFLGIAHGYGLTEMIIDRTKIDEEDDEYHVFLTYLI